MPTSLVLGTGNILLSDEGAGIHVLDYLKAHHPFGADVQYLDRGTLSFTLVADIARADNLVVIDAARLGKPPGSVACFRGAEFDTFIGKPRLSAHEVGMTDLIDMARLTDSLPVNRALVGIEPREPGWGETPCPTVKAAIPVAAKRVLECLKDWNALPATTRPSHAGATA